MAEYQPGKAMAARIACLVSKFYTSQVVRNMPKLHKAHLHATLNSAPGGAA